ncbi:cation diffusion facilitator, putative [Talaromyces stipitatus ATCC 10500]|uniref:Cation diffusion facilitator, putative n=1 Tax=Talaromyces stipitatus (strain ATCC 10500 / CBS 375.48 / QM 6759 / NRRL 1006) TaxID=441959 RepID=B8MNI8_TALSN|nr:cation diffusion facilitator, putative [Talaromyces stipitatus ATCC 10500]EED14077.1 cation diffusion facilitator, putative [Talaromyces stipitatus ATCC 10500]
MSSPRRPTGLWEAQQHQRAPSSTSSSFLEIGPQNGWQMMSTRGQSLPGLLRRYSFSEDTNKNDSADDVENGTHEETISGVRHLTASPTNERPRRRGSILIGDTKPAFRWSDYYTPPEKLVKLRKPVREYYERMNYLVSRYSFVDRLLDSSIARDLLEDYDRFWATTQRSHLQPITEEPRAISPRYERAQPNLTPTESQDTDRAHRQLNERTPLLLSADDADESMEFSQFSKEQDTRRIVMLAIYINLIANLILLIAKIVVTLMTSSVSVLASLVDAALDFLSTAIVWSTTRLTVRRDRHRYPVGRQRLEPLGVLIFSVVMITSFFQVAILSVQRLGGEDRNLVELTIPALAIMGSTVAIKGLCWIWCRRINNSNVQALAQDAMTDVVFNIFSIIFPLIGTFTNTWYLDPLGGFLLSMYVIVNWASTANEHIAHLTGAAASPLDRSVLLYTVMRFAECIRWIQNLEAYYSGDRLNVEVDIVLDGHTSLHDSHDIGESLQYMLESQVANVDRAFVHLDYAEYNLPTHVDQHS